MNAVLRSFSQLLEVQQRIVVLKAQGMSHESISGQIAKEYDATYSKNTINQYFAASGTLEQALHEYNAMAADEWLREARTQAKLHSKTAINTFVELLDQKYDPAIRLGAAKALADKYLPDNQKDDESVRESAGLPNEVRKLLSSIVRRSKSNL